MQRVTSGTEVSCVVRVTTPLPADLGLVPFAPVIDFAAVARAAGVGGVLDVDSIHVTEADTGAEVPFARSDDLLYGDQGRLEWVIAVPACTDFRITFRTTDRRRPPLPQAQVPAVGCGDLLRYNAGVPRPVILAHSMKLVDLDGDGRADLAGCWNYYRRQGEPLSGVVYYPRVGADEDFEFGDMVRLRYLERPEQSDLHHFPGVYAEVDFVDLDGDGLVDLLYAVRGEARVTVYRNTGARDGGGHPVFCRSQVLELPEPFGAGLRGVDLDGDGAIDLVVDGRWHRNAGGWLLELEPGLDLGAGSHLDFVDLDGSGQLDMVCLPPARGTAAGRFADRVQWRRRSGPGIGFGPPQDLPGCDEQEISVVSVVADAGQPGLLIQCDTYQRVVHRPLVRDDAGVPVASAARTAGSRGAVLALSDQAWPCACDWDGDGDWDLLVGGGYGWPRIVRNDGTSAQPALALPARLAAADGVIRVLRDELLHSRHWHNMGYPYPVFVDWDGDGLPDLLLPNETNRIVWHRNTGTRREPAFGPRQYIEVDGYPDSGALRAASGRMAEDRTIPNAPYPTDPRAPFFWRTGAAFADWNGDGLMDFITHDWRRRATLFTQYQDAHGRRRVRRAGPVHLEDGRVVDDRLVGREKHWTESFRAVDWDGDGRLDLMYSLAGTGQIYLLRNTGTRQQPRFAPPRQMKCYGEPITFTIHGPSAWAGDLNGDGKPDLLGCVEWSVYPFYAHAALEMEEHPEFVIEAVAATGG